MTKYIQLAIGQTVKHVSNKYADQGVGDVVSFSDSGFRVKWRNSGQEIDYSPGTSMLRIVPIYEETRTPGEIAESKAGLQSVLALASSLAQLHAPVTGRPKSNALDKVELRNQVSQMTLTEFQKLHGQARGALEFQVRCQGKTTGIIHKMIGIAMLTPYTWHPLESDHHVTKDADESLLRRFKWLLPDLGYRGFEFIKEFNTWHYRFVPIVKETTRTTSETIIESYR